MKFATGYLVCLFAALFCAAQFADHLAAKMCAERTIMTYDQCRQHKPGPSHHQAGQPSPFA